MASHLVGQAMAPAQTLAEVFAPHHQIGAIEPEAGPVLENPQALPGPIEIGIQQSLDRLEVGRPKWARRRAPVGQLGGPSPITAGNRGGNGGRRGNRHSGCGGGGWSVT